MKKPAKATVRKTVPKKTVRKKMVGKAPAITGASADDQERRVRRICSALPQTTEKLSHGAPTFFVAKKVYTMFVNNHHNDGHIAVWIPVAPGLQATLLKTEPNKFFMPPYVGVRGWVGIELEQVSDDELGFHLTEAWRLIAPKKIHSGMTAGGGQFRL